MKYVRNMEDVKKFTFEFFDSFLPQDLSDKMVNYFLLSVGDGKTLEQSALKCLKAKPLSISSISEYGEVILQLRNYRALLKKFVELLLKSHSFEGLACFLNRIFLQQIGDVKYRSQHKEYSMRERYFDRFIEIVEFCDIDKELYFPFFRAIFNCDDSSNMFFFKEPLKEYLDVNFRGDQNEEFLSKLLYGEEDKSGLTSYVESGSTSTLEVLIKSYMDGAISNMSLLKGAILNGKDEAKNIILDFLKRDDKSVFKVVRLLSLIKSDDEVLNILKGIYEKTKDNRVKLFLEKECNFGSFEKFNSEDDFFSSIESNVKHIQERLYGARLKKYYEKYGFDNSGLNGKLLTYVMDFFKMSKTYMRLNLVKEHFKFLGRNFLNRLSHVVYEVAIYRHKLTRSKWALRLIATFGDHALFMEIAERLKGEVKSHGSLVKYKYFLRLLARSNMTEMINISRELFKVNLSVKDKKFLNKIIEGSLGKSGESMEEIQDKLSYDSGFSKDGNMLLKVSNRILKLQINDDCSISVLNPKTGKIARIRGKSSKEDGLYLKSVLKDLRKKVKLQRKRLYMSFLEFRNYSMESFKSCIIQNNLLNFLSSHLFWGRYREGKFVEACMLSDDKLVHVAGDLISSDFGLYTIAILQPMDIGIYKRALMGKIHLLFDEFSLPIFLPKDLKGDENFVNNLNGVFCNAKLFVTRLEKMQFKINDLDSHKTFGTLVKANKNTNMITSVEFDRVPYFDLNRSTTLRKVRFYDYSKTIRKGKIYNLGSSEALKIGDIDPHLLSNELGFILSSCKK